MHSRLATCSALLPLISLVSAHFTLVYPTPRGFNEDTLPQFPCGGQNVVSGNRTAWPSGGPIQLNMGHTSQRIQVLMALGNEPGNNFNIVVRPTFQEAGPNNFCMGMVTVPASVNVTAGMNATIQVVISAEDSPTGAFYNCADITFTNSPLSPEAYSSNCMNSTGVTASPITGTAVNANSTSASGSASTTSASTSATPKSAASRIAMGGWGLGAMGVLGSLLAL